MKTDKVEKLVANLHKKFKQTVNYRLVLKKVHRVIKLSQKTWLKCLLVV